MIFNVSEIVALPESMGLLPSPVIVSVPGIRYFILDKKTSRQETEMQTMQKRCPSCSYSKFNRRSLAC